MRKYYDKVTEFYYWNKMHHRRVDHIYKRYLFKIKDEYAHRMIRKGYADSENRSFGKYFDIERAFHGYPGPLTQKLNNYFKK